MYFSQDKKSSIQGLTIFKKKKKQRKITAAPVFLLVIDITNRHWQKHLDPSFCELLDSSWNSCNKKLDRQLNSALDPQLISVIKINVHKFRLTYAMMFCNTLYLLQWREHKCLKKACHASMTTLKAFACSYRYTLPLLEVI